MNAKSSVAASVGFTLCIAFGLVGCDMLGINLAGTTPSIDTSKPSETVSRAGNKEKTRPETNSKLANVRVPQGKSLLLPEHVVGGAESDIKQLLGRPSRISEKPPAVVWRYESQNCHLSLFFYMDVNTNAFRVLTYEVGPKSANTVQCIDTLRSDHESRSGN